MKDLYCSVIDPIVYGADETVAGLNRRHRDTDSRRLRDCMPQGLVDFQVLSPFYILKGGDTMLWRVLFEGMPEFLQKCDIFDELFLNNLLPLINLTKFY